MTKITIDRSTVEQALEALKGLRLGMPDSVLARSLDQRIDALRAALAEPQEPVQEPVYWEVRCTAHPKWMRVDEQQFDEYVSYGWEGQRLYTTPPQRDALVKALRKHVELHDGDCICEDCAAIAAVEGEKT